jgi:ABC-2 type transport system permease protein
MVPATSLVEEKQKRPLQAVTITPATVSELLAAKALLGILLSLFMGVLTLILNRAFGNEPGLLVLILALGSVFSALLGLLLGSFVKDINTLFTITKAGGLLLYAPALVYLFPQIPQWIGRIFPTYYMINPLVEVTQRGASFADVWPDLAILSLSILALIGAVALVVNRSTKVEGTLNIA